MNFKPDGSSAEDTKKRAYLKQQHQLRTMTKSAAPLSADNMIESLLSKKEIFQKKSNQQESTSQLPQVGPWPAWLTPGREPAQYRNIWQLVGSPSGLADTNKLTQLLMTSRLTTETLGYIWSLCNATVPGSLTQPELNIALALVALAQSGYTFANSNVVRQLVEAPLPALDLHNFQTPSTTSSPGPALNGPSSLHPQISTISAASEVQISKFSQVTTITENISHIDVAHELSPTPSPGDPPPARSLAVLSATDLGKDLPQVKSSETNLIFSDFQTGIGGPDDDFDDFKSADVFSAEMHSLTVLDVLEPKIEEVKNGPTKPEESSVGDDVFPRCVPKRQSPDFLELSSVLKLEPPVFELKSSRTKNVDGGSSFNFLDSPKAKSNGRSSSAAVLPSARLKLDLPEPISLELKSTEPSKPSSVQPSSLSGVSIPPVAEMGALSLMPQNEAAGPSEDKYSALRLLDSGLFSSAEGQSVQPAEDFGDFLTADVPPSSSSQTLKETDDDIQIKCLEACLKLLREAVIIFDNIEDPKVLDEVAANARGRSYLQEILEVERIGRRIRSTRDSCDLISEFETLSKILQPYIEYVKNNHLEEQYGPKCGICLCEHGPAHVKYGINHFHAPCANLYLHMVDPILPIAPVM